MKKKLTLLLLSLICSGAVSADPAPFGLELGKTTVEEVKANYAIQLKGISKYNDGEIYDIPVSQIDFEGLQGVTLIFGRQGELAAVLATLHKNRFDYVYGGLKQKYQLVSQQTPFVGNKSARFVDGGTEVRLDAPHMSFQMSMSYLRKEFLSAYERQSAAEAQQKQQSEMGQL